MLGIQILSQKPVSLKHQKLVPKMTQTHNLPDKHSPKKYQYPEHFSRIYQEKN